MPEPRFTFTPANLYEHIAADDDGFNNAPILHTALPHASDSPTARIRVIIENVDDNGAEVFTVYSANRETVLYRYHGTHDIIAYLNRNRFEPTANTSTPTPAASSQRFVFTDHNVGQYIHSDDQRDVSTLLDSDDSGTIYIRREGIGYALIGHYSGSRLRPVFINRADLIAYLNAHCRPYRMSNTTPAQAEPFSFTPDNIDQYSTRQGSGLEMHLSNSSRVIYVTHDGDPHPNRYYWIDPVGSNRTIDTVVGAEEVCLWLNENGYRPPLRPANAVPTTSPAAFRWDETNVIPYIQGLLDYDPAPTLVRPDGWCLRICRSRNERLAYDLIDMGRQENVVEGGSFSRSLDMSQVLNHLNSNGHRPLPQVQAEETAPPDDLPPSLAAFYPCACAVCGESLGGVAQDINHHVSPSQDAGAVVYKAYCAAHCPECHGEPRRGRKGKVVEIASSIPV